MRTCRLTRTLALLAAFALPPGPLSAQSPMSPQDEAIYRQMIKNMGLDPAAVKAGSAKVEASRRWAEAKGGLIHYRIEGVFQGAAKVVGGGTWSGFADVTDRVVIDLDWNLGASKMVGPARIQNSKSSARGFRDAEPKCLPPILRGEYEHFDLLGIKNGPGGALEMQVRTAYPVAQVAQMCTGPRVTVPASTWTRAEELVVLSPVLLDGPSPDSDNLRIAKDRKSMSHKKGGWTWTFTPSLKP